MAKLEGMIADGRNVYFAHTMAGGIPKAKVFLAIANRVLQGQGRALPVLPGFSTATWAS